MMDPRYALTHARTPHARTHQHSVSDLVWTLSLWQKFYTRSSLAHVCIHTLSHTHTVSVTHAQKHTLCTCVSHTYTHVCALTYTRDTNTLCLSHTHTTHTHTPHNTHTHTHTHTHTQHTRTRARARACVRAWVRVCARVRNAGLTGLASCHTDCSQLLLLTFSAWDVSTRM